MSIRYEKPNDSDVRSLRRQQLVADRVHRWTYTVTGDDEAVSVRRWWSLSDLYRSLAYGVELGWRQPPTQEQFYQKFWAAREAGIFDAAGKTRIALLDPTLPTEPTTPWPQLRLTSDRARQLVKTNSNHMPYQRLAAAWIEIDLAHQWLLTWVHPEIVRPWSQAPQIAQSLQAAARHRERLTAIRARGADEPLAASRAAAPRSTEVEVSSPRHASGLEAAVRKTMSTLGRPPQKVPWKRFCDEVRAQCGVGSKDRGYGDKTIQRVVNEIKASDAY